MTQRELIVERVKTMDAKELYDVFDSSFRYLNIEEKQTLCDFCEFRKSGDRDICTQPDGQDCPPEVYTAWANQEAVEYDA